jgi:hypothetical protein
MNKFLYRVKDRIEEWIRYPQPTGKQKKLLGLYTDVIDTDFTAVRLASEESAQYIVENMRAINNFPTDYDLHEWVITQLDPELASTGLFLEFGVATGRTLNHFGRLISPRHIHGFDGFKGLPEDWTSRMQKGFFSREVLPSVRENCKLHVGWFDCTLPKFLETHTAPIALLHVDSDLYSSAKYVLENLKNQIVSGTVIVFDEYINYPGWQLDEFRAWKEFCDNYNVSYQYIGYVSKHQKVAVKIL